MKFATQTINDMQHEYIKVYKTELEKVTNNRIKVEIYPASQLGGAPRQTEGLRLGTIEAAIGPAELFVGADPRFQVPALAGLYRNREHLRRMVDVAEFRKAIFDVAAARGTVGHQPATATTCSRSSSRPRSPRSPISPASASACWRRKASRAPSPRLGGSAVPMSLPEVLPALQQGTIDGVNSVLGVFVAFRYHDAAPNLVDTALWPILSAALISKVWFDRLPPDLKKAVLETGPKIEPELAKWQVDAHRERHQGLDREGRQDRASSRPSDQEEAVRRVSAAAQTVVGKSAPLKDLYDKLKADYGGARTECAPAANVGARSDDGARMTDTSNDHPGAARLGEQPLRRHRPCLPRHRGDLAWCASSPSTVQTCSCGTFSASRSAGPRS